MRVELLTDIGQIASIQEAWSDFAVKRGNAFVSPEWMLAWETGSEEGAEPLIAAVRDGSGALRGVLPLVRDRGSRPRSIRFPGAAYGDRFHPAAAVEDEAEVARLAMGAIRDHGHREPIVLTNADDAGGWVGAMAGASRREVLLTHPPAELPKVTLAGLEWESYMATRSRSFRSTLGRAERKLLKNHGLEVRTTSEPGGLAGDLASFFALHDMRRSEMGGSSLDDAGARRSLEQFAAHALDRGWLRLRIMDLDGSPASAFFGWSLGGTYAFYQSGFDPAWSKQSVGLLSLALAVRSALDEGAGEFDMLLGEESYKRRFTDSAREVASAVLVGRARPARLQLQAESLARNARERYRHARARSGRKA